MSPMTICEGLKELKIVMQPKPTYRATRLISAIARLSPPRASANSARHACRWVIVPASAIRSSSFRIISWIAGVEQ